MPRHGYATRHMEETGYAIAAVLPVNPSYFWREAMAGLREAQSDASDCTCVYALYSALSQEEEFLQCLEDAVKKSTRVLIAAAPSSNLVQQRLEDIARERCVILLNEGPAAENTYYVGMNAYEDGWGLAYRSASLLKNYSRILMVRCAESNHRTERRNEGGGTKSGPSPPSRISSTFAGAEDRLPACGKEEFAVPEGTYERVRNQWLEKKHRAGQE